MKKQKTIVY